MAFFVSQNISPPGFVEQVLDNIGGQVRNRRINGFIIQHGIIAGAGSNAHDRSRLGKRSSLPFLGVN